MMFKKWDLNYIHKTPTRIGHLPPAYFTVTLKEMDNIFIYIFKGFPLLGIFNLDAQNTLKFTRF